MSRFGLTDATLESLYIGSVAAGLTFLNFENLIGGPIVSGVTSVGLPGSLVRPAITLGVVFTASFLYNNILYMKK